MRRPEYLRQIRYRVRQPGISGSSRLSLRRQMRKPIKRLRNNTRLSWQPISRHCWNSRPVKRKRLRRSRAWRKQIM